MGKRRQGRILFEQTSLSNKRNRRVRSPGRSGDESLSKNRKENDMAVLKNRPERALPEGLGKSESRGVFLCTLPVLWCDLDANGHLNNGRYQSYLDEARMQAFDHAGLGVATMRANNQGPVIYEATLRYRSPVEHPESLTILTWLDSTNRSRGNVKQEIYRASDQCLVCEASFKGIFMDFNRGRPINFPERFLDAFGLA